MKKAVQRIYIVVITAFLLVPVAVFALVGKYTDTTNYENRTLAAAPILGETSVDSFPSSFESWFNDHLPFRNQILTLNGWIDYKFLHTSSSDTAIVGKDGWLFYKGTARNGEDTVADYLGTNLFTEEELQQIASNLETIQAQLRDRGCEFYLFLAPNKESVYSEYMPDSSGAHTSYARLRQVTDYLKNHTDIKVVNAEDELEAYKKENPDQQLYYKYDTHWNSVGAYVGTKELTNTLGYDQVPLSECTLKEVGGYTFDLARMIHLSQVLTDDPVYEIRGYTPHSLKMTSNESGTQFTFETDNTAPGNTIFVVGDSFSAFSAPYYVCHYQHGFMTYYYDYSLSQLDETKPTVFVYEVVERYLGNLAKFSLTGGLAVEED